MVVPVEFRDEILDYLEKEMDHFSREDEELARAMDDGTLQRNFQGCSTLAGADLYLFGVSGISNVDNYYWQNTKDLGAYYEQLDEGKTPIGAVQGRPVVEGGHYGDHV